MCIRDRYLRALRLRAAECALAGDRDGALAASDAVVATLTDVLGEGHPERGVAMLEAAEVAAAAAAAGAADAAGIKKSSGSGGERNVAAKNADAYALAASWARPAYDFASAFYGPRSLPAARAAWCVAEALRRAEGARRARPMVAQALGSTAAALGPGHPSVGAMMTAVAELSRAEGRLEEADAFAREGLAVARREADAAA